jgi:hypothetical protein
MEQITKWVTDNWILLLAIGAALETLAGMIPDKWVPYIGALRTFSRVIKGKGKSGKASVGAMAIIAILSAAVLMSGCAGFKLNTPEMQQITNLTISIGAKALGLKLAPYVDWTPEIELLYNSVINDGTISIDAAQIAEKYVKENIDPLMQDDVLELAKLVGFEFSPAGELIGTDKVNKDFIIIAAKGIRMALMSKGE